ncbi:MAG: hypothetical protein HY906_08315 [Deltaproteobacteria bacterium]|nr:hypothetical protein [Deltaproteobacteria bacterium]
MRSTLALLAVTAVACAPPGPTGLAPTPDGEGPRVKFDVLHRPLPEIPLPNDFASRFDATSPTSRRVNASVEVAPTRWEQGTRSGLNAMSGWGTLAPVTVAFEGPLDLLNIVARHQRPADVDDDVLYVFDVTAGSPEFCKPQLLDLGQGHFPLVLDKVEYYPDEPHLSMQSLLFEQEEEDLNSNGVMDPGEDTDMDGVLDHPNTLPGRNGPFDVIGFYEKETNTLIARPLYPLRESTTYAVVLTNRLLGEGGAPVRSPFAAINHLAQTKALNPVTECLSGVGLGLPDVAFAWSFTTQSLTADYRAFRDGLYGKGPLAFLGTKYPVEVASIPDARRATADNRRTKTVPGEQFLAFGTRLLELYGGVSGGGTKDLLNSWLSHVDFYATATFVSPQLFPRRDANGALLPLYEQVMDPHVGRQETFHRGETIPFLLSVPKKRNGPAPVAIFMHGHSGSKLDSLLTMGPFARSGIATIGMDAVSHGVGLDETDRLLVSELVKPYGLDPLAAVMTGDGRGVDQNGDGIIDSGADYFTGYVTHTRDVVRQTAIDLMQMVRLLRSFDGKRRWAHDVNRDGENDLAGDFDGDGVVDLGGPDVPIYVAGASLGGILSSLMGGIEPDIDAIAPVLPGGYLSEIGTRSDLGQVRNPLVLRMMGPLFLVRNNAGAAVVSQMVPNLTKTAEPELATLPAPLRPGSLAVLRNLKTQEWRCARAQANGHLRVAVPSDEGDALRLEFYAEELPSQPREGCNPTGFTPSHVVEKVEKDFTFQGKAFTAGAPVTALGDGFGLRRGSPDLRRLITLAQVALEPADPANFAPFWDGHRDFTHSDGSQVSTRALLLPMAGDPGVPVATAVALARAARFVDYENVDPRYGKTQMQQLIDVGFVEGAERTLRYLDASGRPVLMDVDVLQNVSNADDGFGAPRLDPPMRLLRPSHRPGGTVGVLFPMMDPRGKHSLPVPDPAASFDLGTLVINLLADYLGSGGTRVSLEACMVANTCPWLTK